MTRFVSYPLFLLHHFLECFGCETFWPLDGQAEGAVPDQGAEDSKSSGDTKQDCVVTHLCHTIVLKMKKERKKERERERERGENKLN